MLESLVGKAQAAGVIARVAGHVLVEKARNDRPTSLDDVPRSVDALTPQWLTAALCRDVPGARVVGVSAVGGSDGSTSRRGLRIEYNDAGTAAGLPTSVYTKSTPRLLSRLITVPASALVGEKLFYDAVRPGLDIEAPVGYHMALHPAAGRSMFLMEDVATSKAVTFGDPTKHVLDRKNAESMVELLGTLHGAMYDSPRLDGELRTVKPVLRWQVDLNHMINFPGRSLVGFDRAADVIPAACRRRRAEVWPAVMRSLEMHERAPRTLLHQDVHARNWYIRPDGVMGLYDWQCMAQGIWALDVAYALSAGLTVSDRRAWERDLLQRYLEHLAEAGGPKLTFDEAWRTYRQQAFHGFAFWLYTIGYGKLQPQMQPDDVCLKILERQSNMIVDLDCFEALDE